MKLSLAPVVLLLITYSLDKSVTKAERFVLDPDIDRNVSELISTKGYPVENHEVVTADGYILPIQRIPYGILQHSTQNCKRVVVLLVHGICLDSSSWVINFPEQSLGFILADHGYDVWLGNMRGNPYARRHLNLTADMKSFWDFSFDEHSQYDLPATIDYVLNSTGEQQLICIGYSQGTTSAFALLSQSPEYNHKIQLFVGLAPVTTAERMTHQIRNLIPYADNINLMLKLLGIYEIDLSGTFKEYFKYWLCFVQERSDCSDLLTMLLNYGQPQLNSTRIPVYSSHFLSSVSVKALTHYAQMMSSKKFQKYDYGMFENNSRYNQSTPPKYDVTKITTPVILIWSSKDMISNWRDVKELQKQLPSLVSSYQIPYKNFRHLDYLMAVDAYKILYEKVFSKICKHSK